MVSAGTQILGPREEATSSREGPLKKLADFKTPEDVREAVKILRHRQRNLAEGRSGPHRRAESHRTVQSRGKIKMDESTRHKNRPAKTSHTVQNFWEPNNRRERRDETPSPRRGSFQQSRQTESIFNRLGSDAPRRPRGRRAESVGNTTAVRRNLENSFEVEAGARFQENEGMRVSVHNHLGMPAPFRPHNPESDQLEAIKLQTLKKLQDQMN